MQTPRLIAWTPLSVQKYINPLTAGTDYIRFYIFLLAKLSTTFETFKDKM